MLTDKLLAFADQKALTTTANSDVVDLGPVGDEADRSLNLVAQLDDCGGVTPESASIAIALQMSPDGGTTWNTVESFPAVTVEQAKAGKRLINFAKLPLGGLGGQMRLAVTINNGPLVGAKYSAWLTRDSQS